MGEILIGKESVQALYNDFVNTQKEYIKLYESEKYESKSVQRVAYQEGVRITAMTKDGHIFFPNTPNSDPLYIFELQIGGTGINYGECIFYVDEREPLHLLLSQDRENIDPIGTNMRNDIKNDLIVDAQRKGRRIGMSPKGFVDKTNISEYKLDSQGNIIKFNEYNNRAISVHMDEKYDDIEPGDMELIEILAGTLKNKLQKVVKKLDDAV